MTPLENTIPFGYCHCGCGRETAIATKNDPKWGWIKGQPSRFIRGHQSALDRVNLSEIKGFKINGVLCRLIPLTRGLWTIVDASNYEWLMQWRWYAQKRPDGKRHYAVRAARDSSGKEIKIRMHRLILGLDQGDVTLGDHIRPEETLNNTRGNLRLADAGESQRNRHIPKNNTSGLKGVCWDWRKGKYRGDIVVDGKHKYVGYADTIEEAYKKYEAAVAKYHGNFGNAK